MVFLRELCQNARDAGAQMVDTRVSSDRGFFVLIFTDDGNGMSFAHAEQYLFTLYASSKETDPGNAGKFGVGFWSVLLSDPVIAAVESRTATDDPWKVVFNRDLEVERVAGTGLSRRGTRVTLRYAPDQFRDEDAFRREVERALLKYCRYLRKNRKNGGPLPVSLNGVRMDRPFSIDGPHYMTFENGDVQGAVGLSEAPSVSVFARGLLVWQGTALDELRYGAARRNRSRRISGLAPCFVLNGDRLNATLDRRALIDDAALKRLRSVAENRMDEFLDRYFDRVSPVGSLSKIKRRIARRFKIGGRAARAWVATMLFLAVFFGAWILVGHVVLGENRSVAVDGRDSKGVAATVHGTPSPLPIYLGNQWRYIGPTVGGAETENQQLSLVYRPKIDLYFRIAAMEMVSAGSGIGRGDVSVRGRYTGRPCGENCVLVAAAVKAAEGPLILPLPTGYTLAVESVRLGLGSTTAPTIYANAAEEPTVLLSEAFKGQITYSASFENEEAVLSANRKQMLTSVPEEMATDASVQALVRSCSAMKDVRLRVECATDAVRRILSYDDSVDTVRAYKEFYASEPTTGWTSFVFREGRGDCDVLNAILVVLLRTMGIPARLAVGAVGEAGVIAVGTHAWAEYFETGWQIADASRGARRYVPDGASNAGATRESAKGGAAVSGYQNNIARKTPARSTLIVSGRMRSWFAQCFGSAVVLALLSAFWIFGKGGQPRGGLRLTGKSQKRRVDAAKMAAAALADPCVWQDARILLTRKILSTRGKKTRLSVQDAKHLAASGQLYVAAARSALTESAAARKTPVLDGTDPAFKELVPQLTGAIDLDEIASLNPLCAGEIPPGYEETSRLLSKVQSIVNACGLAGFVGVRLSLSKKLYSVEDISLPGIWANPVHAVVVPQGDPSIREAAQALTPDVGAVVLIDRISSKSDLLFEVRDRLLFEASRRVFEAAT